MAIQRTKLLGTESVSGLASYPGFENYYTLTIPSGTDVFVVMISAGYHAGASCVLGGRKMRNRAELSDGNVRFVSLHDIVSPLPGRRDFVAYWGGGGATLQLVTAALRFVDTKNPLVAAGPTPQGYGSNRAMNIAAAIGGAVVEILSVFVDSGPNTPNAGQTTLYSGAGGGGSESANASFKRSAALLENVGWTNPAGFIAQVAASYRPRTTDTPLLLPSATLTPTSTLANSGWTPSAGTAHAAIAAAGGARLVGTPGASARFTLG